MFLRLLTLLILLPSVATAGESSRWVSYPETLPTFDYSGDKLKQSWPILTRGSSIPYPSPEQLALVAAQYPFLINQPDQDPTTVNPTAAHPALKQAHAGDFSALSDAIAQVWRLHFQGQFEAAYTLGSQLGYAGLVPALYAKMMHSTLLETNPDRRLQHYQETIERAESMAKHISDYQPARFGLTYAYVRKLELLPTSAAVRSGHLKEAKDVLSQMQKQFPERAIYRAMLGGLHAGVVDRVGSFVGRITYGSTESRAMAHFKAAIELENGLPVIFNEYTTAMARLDRDKYAATIKHALKHCINLPVYNAEEALNRQACQNKLSLLTAD